MQVNLLYISDCNQQTGASFKKKQHLVLHSTDHHCYQSNQYTLKGSKQGNF